MTYSRINYNMIYLQGENYFSEENKSYCSTFGFGSYILLDDHYYFQEILKQK